MKKLLGATVLICSGLSVWMQPVCVAGALRPVLTENTSVLSQPAPVVSMAASILLSAAVPTVSLALAPTIRPVGSPIVSPIVIPIAGPISPISTGPSPTIIIYPTNPIIYPTNPISPP
jgi:hypothetical protein